MSLLYFEHALLAHAGESYLKVVKRAVQQLRTTTRDARDGENYRVVRYVPTVLRAPWKTATKKGEKMGENYLESRPFAHGER